MKRIREPEQSNIEFKGCHGKRFAKLPDDLWQSIAAFSNTRGGVIYLGVDDSGRIMGLSNKDLDKLQKDLSSLLNNTFFNRKPKAEITCQDGCIKVGVAELEVYNKPLYSQKVGPRKIFIRYGSTNVLASDEEIRSLFAGADGGGENQVIEGKLEQLVDEEALDDYLSKTGLKDIKFPNLQTKLEKIKASRDGKLNIFGLVAFGNSTTIDEKMNNVYIDFKVFPGKNKVSEELARIYSERKEFHGTLAQQFTQAFEYLKAKIPKEAILNEKTGLREERYILPKAALREALSNALAHRDYLLQNSCVNIDLYADRLEISNPGESLVAIEDLMKASSKSRNPSIMEYLKAYDITDKTARGIPTIYQAAHSRGLIEPKFENISGGFKATLYLSYPHSADDERWVNEISNRYELKDTQKNALIYIKNSGSISNRIYCEINHMNSRNDDKQARRELGKLVDNGIIIKEGERSGTRYKLA